MAGRREVRRGRRQERREDRQERREVRRERRDVRRDQPRQRRSQEVARQLLLDAAERLFAEQPPDAVGLKEIAREAGVSHALITHYFGTYAGLVEATLQRRLVTLREVTMARLREAGVLSRPEELLGVLMRTLDDPVHLRLMKWIMSAERPGAIHTLALQQQGVQMVAQQVAHAIHPQPSRELIDTLELAMMTAVAAVLGYALAKPALAGAAGREVSTALDEAVRRTLAGMLRSYLTETCGPLLAAPT